MRMRTAALAVVSLLLAVAVAGAAESTGWEVELSPGLWFTGIDGTITVDEQEIAFEKSASDVFRHVETTWGALGAVQRDHWVLRAMLYDIGLSTDDVQVEGYPQGGNLESDLLLTEVWSGYRIHGWKEGQLYDVVLALRYTHAEHDLELDGGGSHHRENDLVDPLIAVRGSFPLLPSKIKGLCFNGMAGIGAGGDSKMVYEFQPQLQYEISRLVAARLGYTRIGWKVESDDSDDKLHFSLGGFSLGVALTF